MRRLCILLFLTGWSILLRGQPEVLQYEMSTRWGEAVTPDNVWQEYPRPQMTRDHWTNLNGEWDYVIRSTEEKELPESFDGKILVPFAAESALSGVRRIVGDTNYLWYHRSFTAPASAPDERLLLHFGAVDWEATVYLNGQEVLRHRGGYTPFTADLTTFLKRRGKQELVVRIWDPTDRGSQARGKQVSEPSGIWYTPVTGIWQTVWLESVPTDHVTLLKPRPDVDGRRALVEVRTSPLRKGGSLEVVARDGSAEAGRATQEVGAGTVTATLEVPLEVLRLWSPEDPFLYDLEVTLRDADGGVVDRVAGYLGMRKMALGQDANGYTVMLLNDEPVFQLGLLDQGWWPDGLYTAPSKEAMLYDVELTEELGFNMIRKHVKVEPAQFYYECDRRGMLVWQDMPNGHPKGNALRIQAWEPDAERPVPSADQFETELKEMIDHLYAFPSIVTWVPFNEGWGQYDTDRIAAWTKAYDPTRLCDAPSGWADRGVGDLVDVHIYPGPGMEAPEVDRASVIGEFGGLGYPVTGHLWWDKRNWGYLTFDEEPVFRERFAEVMKDLIPLKSRGLSAAIYTQTTDVEGEVNGLVTYDREHVKLDPAETRALVAPLYDPVHRARVFLADAQREPQTWRISRTDPAGDWTAAEYNDFAWPTARAPFSTFDNYFLHQSSAWKAGDTLYLRRDFYVGALSRTVNFNYYLPKADMEVWINGKPVTRQRDRGGRKRHYTSVRLENARDLLRKGRNTIAVKASAQGEEASFDLGLYGADPLHPDEAGKGK